MPVNYKTSEGYRLGNWVDTQKGNSRSLSDNRKTRLESVPQWHWDSIFDTRWNRGFVYLEEFLDKEGHLNVRKRFKNKDGFSLGTWCQTQRNSKDTLSSERIAQLESLKGWEWNPIDLLWEMGFDHLKSYIIRTGHSRAPHRLQTEDGFSLGTWIATQ